MTRLNHAKLEIIKTHATRHGGSAADVITFSHFLPRKELPLPGVHEMAKASGCLELEAQLRRVGAKLHVFGHTHFSIDRTIDGVRYVQHPLGHTHERNNGWQIDTGEPDSHWALASVWRAT